MALMRTANPALNSKTFTGHGEITDAADAMTLQGTVNRTGILLVLVTLAAALRKKLIRDRAESLKRPPGKGEPVCALDLSAARARVKRPAWKPES